MTILRLPKHPLDYPIEQLTKLATVLDATLKEPKEKSTLEGNDEFYDSLYKAYREGCLDAVEILEKARENELV